MIIFLIHYVEKIYILLNFFYEVPSAYQKLSLPFYAKQTVEEHNNGKKPVHQICCIIVLLDHELRSSSLLLNDS